jgi:hypothetical protein
MKLTNHHDDRHHFNIRNLDRNDGFGTEDTHSPIDIGNPRMMGIDLRSIRIDFDCTLGAHITLGDFPLIAHYREPCFGLG